MHKVIGFAAALLATAAAAAAGAQGIIPSVIASTIANMNRGLPERCLLGEWEPDATEAARFTAAAEPGLRAYLAVAAAGPDVTAAFTRRRSDRRWALDGEFRDVAGARDPWAARVARLELVGLRLSGTKVNGRGLWRAFAADGSALGTYDGLFRRRRDGFEIFSLDLYSPDAAKGPSALTGFCDMPGDVESYREARAEREAARAARRAEREAARAARSAER